jgi:hypothetical protein
MLFFSIVNYVSIVVVYFEPHRHIENIVIQIIVLRVHFHPRYSKLALRRQVVRSQSGT